MSGPDAGSDRDWMAWQKALELAEKVYCATKVLPNEEL
jgi:hypothetical protein